MSPSVPTLLVLVACVYGAVVRLWPALAHSFPVETGGLFYVFVKDILSNHFALPAQSSYNGGLPFAYPPLSFYVAAGVCVVTGADPIAVLRFLPSLMTALTVPAMWLLARRLVTPVPAAWATVAFAIVPANLVLVEGGGGLPRAMGLLLAILGLEATVVLRQARNGRGTLLRAGALLAAAAACHPEIALFVVSSSALLFLGERHAGWLKRGIALAAVCCGFTALWLIPDVLRHGVATYSGASTQPTPYGFIGGVGHWLSLDSLTGELALPAVQIAALFGALEAVRQRCLWLPLWAIGIIVLDQRAPTLVLPVPVALLAGRGIAESVPALLRPTGARLGVRLRFVAAPLLLPLGLSALYTFIVVSSMTSSLSTEDLAAIRWAAAQTEVRSGFLVVPGVRLFVSEWFPALAERRSVVTHEGSEWLGAATFARTVRDFDAVQHCQDADVACIENWERTTGRAFDYVLVDRDIPLGVALERSSGYQLMYASEHDAIFKRSGTHAS